MEKQPERNADRPFIPRAEQRPITDRDRRWAAEVMASPHPLSNEGAEAVAKVLREQEATIAKLREQVEELDSALLDKQREATIG